MNYTYIAYTGCERKMKFLRKMKSFLVEFSQVHVHVTLSLYAGANKDNISDAKIVSRVSIMGFQPSILYETLSYI